MSKFCKKCGKEIPQSSKKDLCENCQNNRFSKVRKFGAAALSIGGTIIGSIAVYLIKGGHDDSKT